MAFFRKKPRGDVRPKLEPKQQKRGGKQQEETTTAVTTTVTPSSYSFDRLSTILGTASTLVSPSPSEDDEYSSSAASAMKKNKTKLPKRGTHGGQQRPPTCNSTTSSSRPTHGGGNYYNSRHSYTSSSSSVLLSSLNIVATDDIEITTYETQQALMEQREAIRRQLFDPPATTSPSAPSSPNSYTTTTSPSLLLKKPKQQQQQHVDGSRRSILYRTATNASQEILLNGSIVPDNSPSSTYKLSVEQASLPLAFLNQSYDNNNNNNNNNNSADYLDDEIIVPIELAARSYDESLEKKKKKNPVSDRMRMIRARTDPTRDLSFDDSPKTMIRPETSTHRLATQSPVASTTTTMPTSTKDPSSSTTTTVQTVEPPPQQQQQQTKLELSSALNVSSSSIVPMDERRVDQELEYQRNRGKSPLRGMPDDEQREYQRDEIDPGDDEIVLLELNDEEEEEDDNNDLVDEDEEGSIEVEEEDESEYSGMVVPLSSGPGIGLLTGGGLVAAAVGWGANAVDNACIGEDDDEDLDEDGEPPDIPPIRTAASNHHHHHPIVTKSPPTYLSEFECKKFLRRITRNGFVLLNLVLLDEVDTWTGRTVTMCIAKGSQEHPAQLEWTTVTGGQNHEIFVSSVDLMDILTIDTDGIPNDENEDDEAVGGTTTTTTSDNNCIFTITTDDGHVFLFEANSKEERDRIVNGLRTIIARWARHMVTGEVMATTELYASHVPAKRFDNTHLTTSSLEQQRSLPNPTYTMNRLAHRLLDL